MIHQRKLKPVPRGIGMTSQGTRDRLVRRLRDNGISDERVLKAIATHREMTLGDLIEGIVLHSFEGKPPFGPDTITVIEKIKEIYGLDLTAADSHKLSEE